MNLRNAPWGRRTLPPRPIYTAKLHSVEGCRFIIGDVTMPPNWCNKPRRENSSYCEAHHQLTHIPTAPHPVRVSKHVY